MTGDISAQGMFIRTTEELPFGSHQRVEVDLPDESLQLHVIVKMSGRTVSGVGVGVELHPDDEDGQRRWSDYYDRRHAQITSR